MPYADFNEILGSLPFATLMNSAEDNIPDELIKLVKLTDLRSQMDYLLSGISILSQIEVPPDDDSEVRLISAALVEGLGIIDSAVISSDDVEREIRLYELMFAMNQEYLGDYIEDKPDYFTEQGKNNIDIRNIDARKLTVAVSRIDAAVNIIDKGMSAEHQHNLVELIDELAINIYPWCLCYDGNFNYDNIRDTCQRWAEETGYNEMLSALDAGVPQEDITA